MPPSLRPEHLLATILSSTEDSVLSFSLDGLIQSGSSGSEQLYGYLEADAAGQPRTILLPPSQVPVWGESLQTANHGNFDYNEHTERLRKDAPRIREVLRR